MLSRDFARKLIRVLSQMYALVAIAAVMQLFTAVSFAQSTFGEFVGL